MDNPFNEHGRRNPFLHNPFRLVRLPSDCTSAKRVANHLQLTRDALGSEGAADVSWAHDVLTDPNRRLVFAILAHPPVPKENGAVSSLSDRIDAAIDVPDAPVEARMSAVCLAELARAEKPRTTPSSDPNPPRARFAPDFDWLLARFAIEALR
jgi:hypothetical protein